MFEGPRIGTDSIIMPILGPTLQMELEGILSERPIDIRSEIRPATHPLFDRFYYVSRG